MKELAHPEIVALRDPDPFYGFWPWSKGPLWETRSPHSFDIRVPGYQHLSYTIPNGYTFNKASTPPILWGPPLYYTPDGLCEVPSLEHDFLCDLLTGGSPWLKRQYEGRLPAPPPAPIIHEHFRLQLLRYGLRASKAQAWGTAVALLGPKGKLKFWE